MDVRVGLWRSWVLKNWCFWRVVLEKTLESPLDCKEIQPVHSKGDQSLDFFGRNDAKAETPVLWPPCAKSWLIGKYSDAGRDWGQEEKGTTEDEMARWHHQLDGHEFEWTLGVGDGQGGLACCNSWGLRVRHNWATELDRTERLSANAAYWLGVHQRLSARTPKHGVTFWPGLPDNMVARLQEQASQERELSENCLLWPVSKVNHLSCILLVKAVIQIFCSFNAQIPTLNGKKCHHLMVRRTCGMRDVLLWASLQNIICYCKQGNSKYFLLLKTLAYSVSLF